ncbi:hypothetical protein PHLCEN_2v9489 [Hermanssonia centrifuga]|uniref:Uncharacterized protein n=1 Tax=Hermanssonia centrifuga TaxID=98765 RepID=A0A2R6NQP1_9APHY|nr:hypothetical protein PHLCEN_2v9489 [Hermanssonia centrifuga]
MPVECQLSVEIAKNAREAATTRPTERTNSGRTTVKVLASRPVSERVVVPSSVPNENVQRRLNPSPRLSLLPSPLVRESPSPPPPGNPANGMHL